MQLRSHFLNLSRQTPIAAEATATHYLHLLRTHCAKCSKKCLNQSPHLYSPAFHFRLHPPLFLPKALSLMRLHNRRPRRCFRPNRRQAANDKLRPVTLPGNQRHESRKQDRPASGDGVFSRRHAISCAAKARGFRFGDVEAEIRVEFGGSGVDGDGPGIDGVECEWGVVGSSGVSRRAAESFGRAHGVREVYEAMEIVGECGVENWSMDLISSLPHQTPEMWEESLRLTVEAHPTHVSVYDLQVEQGTKFGLLYTPGEFPLPSETRSAEFYKMASRMLSDAGYNHYEISSYCKSGCHCRHNLTYWKNKPFYAFGLGSASYVDGVRFSRPKRMKEYTGYVENLENGLVDRCEINRTAQDMATDVVMLSLRTSRGLDLKSFGEAYGSSLVLSLCKAYKPYVESGHVVFLDEQRRAITADAFDALQVNKDETERSPAYIRLSDPDGFLLSNELISLAFAVVAP